VVKREDCFCRASLWLSRPESSVYKPTWRASLAHIRAGASYNGIDFSRRKILPSFVTVPSFWGSKGNAVRGNLPNAAAAPATVSGESCVICHWEPRSREGGARYRSASQETCRQPWSHAKMSVGEYRHCATPLMQGTGCDDRSDGKCVTGRCSNSFPGSIRPRAVIIAAQELEAPGRRARSDAHQERHPGKWSIG
jgi:hypothetical protein